MNMFNKVGNIQYVLNPLGALPVTNINFDDSWIIDPVFSQPVLDFLDTFSQFIFQDTTTCLIKYYDYSDPDYTALLISGTTQLQ